MKRKNYILWLVIAALIAFCGWKLYTAHFDWLRFLKALQNANPYYIIAAVLIVYSNYLIRAWRWSLFLRHNKKVGALSLTGTQFIGFTGLAIFGRLGELIRPYLVSRRTGLSFSSQIAVVTVERIFDLGAFAILFSVNLIVFAPQLNTLPFHEKFHTMGLVIAGLTIAIALFAYAIAMFGGAVASITKTIFSIASEKAGAAVAEKIIEFRTGLNAIRSVHDFLYIGALSILLWSANAVSYICVMRAFAEPVHSLTLAHVILLMGFSIAGSVLQLPGVGGGSQVATIGALNQLFGIPLELAFSAGIVLWLVCFMAVIPAGLIFARIEHVSLKNTVESSEKAAE